MSVAWAVVAAIASACCAATSSVLQHRSVGDAPAGRGARFGLILHLLRQPVWLLGALAAAAALGLHALALVGGQLALVQPLLVSGLLFALPARALVDSLRPSLGEWLWALLLISGLVLFLESAQPSAGNLTPDTPRLLTAIAMAGVLGVIAVFLGAGVLRRFRAVLFGLSTGIAYGIVAALLKYCVGLISTGFGAVLSNWPLYALILCGAVAIVLNQAAYQSGPLAACLPPLTLADPVTGAAIGAVAFSEVFATTPPAITGEIIGAVAVAVAVIQLARRSTPRAEPVQRESTL